VKSGFITDHEGQAERLNQAHTRLSGLLEKACLQLSAKESFQAAEADIEMLTELLWGILTRLVHRQTFELPEQPITEVSIDGARCACEISKIQRVPELQRCA